MSNGTPKQEVAQNKPDRKALAETGKRIDSIREDYQKSYLVAGNDYERTMILAASLIDLKQAIREYLPVLKQIQGSRLGFLTDRDPGKDTQNKGPYPDGVLIDCAIEAVMRGARWTGNEFNIIAGSFYPTKAYWWRMVTEFPGLTDLDLNPDVPEFVSQKCIVSYEATWKLDGRVCSMKRRIPVIVRGSQTDDATLGKADSKMLRAIHRRLTGSDLGEPDEDETMGAGGTSRSATSELKNRLNGTKAALAPPKEEPKETPKDAAQNDDDPPSLNDWQGNGDEREKHLATK